MVKAATNPNLRVVLYEGEGSSTLDADQRFDAMQRLLESGYSVTRASGERPVSRGDDRAVAVLGRFDDPDQLDTGLEADAPVHIHDVTDRDTDTLLNTVESVNTQVAQHQTEYWKPWFPVIDFDRCTNCMQCLSFCLFDVYGVDDKQQIEVRNQDNCKTDCPACSRVCPEVAILFPKYRHGPINGDAVKTEDIEREKMKVDISSLLGGDIYAALKTRNAKFKSRFAKERDEDKALAERKKCLTKLAEQFDIPAEALEHLPTMSEIQAKAEAAAARTAEQQSSRTGDQN